MQLFSRRHLSDGSALTAPEPDHVKRANERDRERTRRQKQEYEARLMVLTAQTNVDTQRK